MAPSAGLHVPKPEEIRRQLDAILASPVFHGSKRCQQFLEYVCDKALHGEHGFLKERNIAIEVFGRAPHSDLAEDTIVRVGAREVRKRLAQYYATAQGMAAEIRLDLPLGSYVPEFRYGVALHEDPPMVPEPAGPEPPNRRLLWWLAAGAAVMVLVVAGVIRLTSPSPNAAAFQNFWEPVLRAHDPLILAVAHPIVYHPSSRAIKLSEQGLPPQEVPSQRPIQLAANELNGSDLVPVFNQYVGFGDMVAANEVTAMLGRSSREVRVRLANSLGLADLRNAQTLLIGAVTNKWTMELQQSWRFRFAWTPGTRTVITDTQDSTGSRQWTVTSKEDGSAPEDYILIGRVHSSYTGGTVMLAAGLKQFGTEAAGRLLADPDQLGAILRKLPSGWEKRNVQFVLHARVIGNTAAMPELVASHVW